MTPLSCLISRSASAFHLWPILMSLSGHRSGISMILILRLRFTTCQVICCQVAPVDMLGYVHLEKRLKRRLRGALHGTVNVEIFAQYIFSRISHRALDARKFDVRDRVLTKVLNRCFHF